jgi:uncharacterized protein (TIRG00374 family)
MSMMKDLFRNQYSRWAIQLIFAVGLILIFTSRINLKDSLAYVTTINIGWALTASFLFVVSKIVHGFRWWMFVRQRELVKAGYLIGVFLISNTANALLPLRAGDLLRVELPSRRFGIPRGSLASGVFILESALDGLVFSIFLLVTLFTSGLPSEIRSLSVGIVALGLTIFIVVLILSRTSQATKAEDIQTINWVPKTIQNRLRTVQYSILDGLRPLKNNKNAGLLVLVALLAWAIEALVYWCIAHAFGISLSLSETLILMIAANLIVSIPLTPWDIGPYEIAVTAVFVVIGLEETEAAGLAIGSHLLIQATVLLAGAVAMTMLNIPFRGLVKRNEN